MSRSRLLIALLVIILLVVYTYFGTDYMKQRREHEVLAAQITEVTGTIAEIPEPALDLGEQLAAVQASLAAEQAKFPSKLNSTRVINAILSIADDCQVKAIPLVSEPWLTENIGEHDYRVFRLNVAVEGSLQQLLSFVSQLENGELKTLIIEDVSVTGAGEQPEGRNVPITASLALAIYARPVTSD